MKYENDSTSVIGVDVHVMKIVQKDQVWSLLEISSADIVKKTKDAAWIVTFDKLLNILHRENE